MESENLENVNFIRDEMSNMVWAIEQIVQSEAGMGRIVKRNVPSLKDDFQPMNEEAKIRYILDSTVPENWIPFIPVHKQGDSEIRPEIRLQRARMPRQSPRLSKVLTEYPAPYFIEEKEIPKAGVIITRSFQRTRWLNGKTMLWIGRRKQAGRGEGSANLMFDQVVPIKRE